MRKYFFGLFILLIGTIFIQTGSGNNPGVSSTTGTNIPLWNSPVLNREFGKVPLYFIPNRGQVHKKAKFYARTAGYTLWMTQEGLVFDSTRTQSAKSKAQSKGLIEENSRTRSALSAVRSAIPGAVDRDVSRLVFIKSNKNPQIAAVDTARYRVNYFKGKDKSKWRQNIPTSKAVLYKNLYKNIDLKVYGIERQVEYDWIVKPGGNPADIKFAYKNVKSTRIDDEGNLLIETGFGKLVHKRPVSYQEVKAIRHKDNKAERVRVRAQRAVPEEELQPVGAAEEKRIPIDVRFKKVGRNSYCFAVGEYDKNRELVIDPVITMVYSTYLGGNSDDYGYGISLDRKGCAYVTGSTYSSNFPLKNPYTGTSRSDSDVFVTKFSPSGNSLVFSTYLGGCRYDQVTDIAVDKAGNAYITGCTESLNFPTKNAFQWYLKIISYYDCYGVDAFVTKLSKDGSDLVYSTYIGGDDVDESVGIAVSSTGCAYITGFASNNFPTKNPLQVGTYGSFITKFSPAGNTLVYSTYYDSGGCDIAVDIHGNAYVVGRRITKLSSSGSHVIYSTSLDESGATSYGRICVDRTGCAYITGSTYNPDFPVKNPVQGTYGGGESDMFIAKLSSNGYSCKYATLLGGSDREYGNGIAVDSSGCAYVTGVTYSVDFPIKNPLQDIRGGGDNDIFILKLTAAGSDLVYSTYFGGRGNEKGSSIAVDLKGNAYVTGETTSPDFPTRNPFQEYQYASDAFVTKLHCDYSPTISITSPKNGAVLSKTLVIRTKVEDDVGVSRVNFYIDEKIRHTDNQSPFSYRWDSFRISNGTHKIKAAALDTAGQQAEDEITVTTRNVILILRVSKQTERAWLISRDYAKIDMTVENPYKFPVAKYIVYRKKAGGLYQAIKEIPGAELQSGTYSFNDLYLEKGKTYYYKAEALDANGMVIGASAEQSIRGKAKEILGDKPVVRFTWKT